jgi:hypothetical protein
VVKGITEERMNKLRKTVTESAEPQLLVRRGVAGKRWMYRTFLIGRVFKANLQKKTIEIDGQSKQVTMCAKCIKRLKFDTKQAMTAA